MFFLFFIVFYAVAFFLLSVVTGAVFFVFPKLRPYTLHAFVAPLAFGASAILGWLAIVLFEDFILHVNFVPDGNWALMIYIALGLCGAATAVYGLNFLQSQLPKILQSPPTSSQSVRIRPF